MGYQKDELTEILSIFQQESSEIISSMDSKLLELERNGINEDMAIQLFRDAHSLKGSARMLGFVDIQNLAHKIEDVISLIKENKLPVTTDITDSISESLAFISQLIEKTVEQKEEYKSELLSKYLEKLNKIIENSQNSENNALSETSDKQAAQKDRLEDFTRCIYEAENNPDKYSELIEFARETKERYQNVKIRNILSDIEDIIQTLQTNSSSLKHDVATIMRDALSSFSKDEDAIKDTELKVSVIKTMIKFQYKKTNKNNVAKVSQKDILNTITNTEIKTLRVDSVKLDNLVGQIRELIISKIKTNEQISLAKKINNEFMEWQKNFSKMEYYIKYFDKKYLAASPDGAGWDYRKIIAYNRQLGVLASQHSESINHLSKEILNLFKQLQESETQLNTTTNEIDSMVKNMRILPLSTIFQLFPRMVHNIARDKNKKIDLIIEGADISADKTIIEEIKIPLMHIIRNSIDHGIEDVETRKNLGKNPMGKIEIIASQKDSKVIIDIKDDGRGLDIEKIKSKALEKKLLTPEEIASISDEELTNLIFYPGFSTEDFVTELSGRGLGLDIVNNKISELQGRVDIFSQLNKGTVVRISIPSTIATKKVFIVEEQNQLYAIETSVIKSIIRLNSEDIYERDGNNYFIYSGATTPVYTLSQILNLEDAIRETDKYTVMVIETDNNLFAIIIEKLIADQEIVHKKLAAPLYKVQHISGITTLANGDACLILNMGDIISTINSRKIGSKIISKNGIIKTKDSWEYEILVLDDSHTTRILEKNILSNHGYSVTTATSPIQALEKIKENQFNLIISDIQMPEMNGFQFVKELRKSQNYENCPVVIISSEPKETYEEEIKETNITKYIQKNQFRQEDFINEIEEILRQGA